MLKSLLTFHGHCNEYSKLSFCLDSDQNFLFGGGQDRYVRIWDVHSATLLNCIGPFNQVPFSVGLQDDWNGIYEPYLYVPGDGLLSQIPLF